MSGSDSKLPSIGGERVEGVCGTPIHNTWNELTINEQELTQIPKKYVLSLQRFGEDVNKILKEDSTKEEPTIDLRDVRTLQGSLDSLMKVLILMHGDSNTYDTYRTFVDERLNDVARNLVRMSPQAAKTISQSSPLTPFNEISGKSFEQVVKRVFEQR